MSNPLKKLAGQTAVYGLSSIVGRLLNYLMVPLYVGVFVNTSDYGVVSELYAWIAFLMVLLTFGMETAFFKFLSDDPENKEKIFRNSMLSIIVVDIVFLLLILFFNGVIADNFSSLTILNILFYWEQSLLLMLHQPSLWQNYAPRREQKNSYWSSSQE